MLRIIITLISLVLASCVQTPPLVDCTSRTDCARNEVCQDGQCLVNTTVYREPKKDEPVDAGQVQPSSDTGVSEDAAASNPDASTTLDTGITVMDASAPLSDAGPPCLEVRIEGRSDIFCSIADAITAALIDDIIVLPPAVISENIVLVSKRLTIRGTVNNADFTIIRPPSGTIGIQSAVDGAQFSSMTIETTNAQAIRVAEDATFTLITITAATGAGISITGNASVEVETPAISGVVPMGGSVNDGDGAGIVSGPTTTLTVRDGSISNCQGSGIFTNSAALNVQGTVFTLNNYGVEARNTNPSTTVAAIINNADFNNNRRSGLYTEDIRVNVANSSSRGNGTSMLTTDAHGLYFGSGTQYSAIGNALRMNVRYGMFCAPDVVVQICSDNLISSNGGPDSTCDPDCDMIR
ncbi:MAG: hypothetical protein VYC39_14305 [Myxococcota bacterium]|nr:hypothetical protein [Myxococcota bacterium]